MNIRSTGQAGHEVAQETSEFVSSIMGQGTLLDRDTYGDTTSDGINTIPSTVLRAWIGTGTTATAGGCGVGAQWSRWVVLVLRIWENLA